jgi:predicted deacylase
MLVHAVNPWGMAHFRRVNPNNVDLNRNFAEAGDVLYRTRNPGYRLIAGALAPRGPCEGALASRARLLAGLSKATFLNGTATLKEALLAGQYDAPEGLFYGGAGRERETRVFADLFGPACARYDEILLVDLHTGYGTRGRVQLLGSVGDSRESIDSNAGDARGPNNRTQGYFVTGDLVAWCRRTAARIKPGGTFNGIVVELGTTGLSLWSQLHDLGTMVRENQLRRHGARTPAIERAVKASFRELFHPADPAWRRDALAAALAAIEDLSVRRGYLAPA